MALMAARAALVGSGGVVSALGGRGCDLGSLHSAGIDSEPRGYLPHSLSPIRRPWILPNLPRWLFSALTMQASVMRGDFQLKPLHRRRIKLPRQHKQGFEQIVVGDDEFAPVRRVVRPCVGRLLKQLSVRMPGARLSAGDVGVR
jgi:hypothetical protein